MSTLIIADHDDPDVVAMEERGFRFRWLRLGLDSGQYDYRLRPSGAAISVLGEEFTSDDVARATRILYRRWRVSPPVTPVNIESSSDPCVRRMVEREWEAALEACFNHWFRINPSAFSRLPGPYPNKLTHLMEVAGLVQVPEWSVASTHGERRMGPCVTKVLSTDQSAPDGGHTSTVAINPQLIQGRQPCPVLIQRRICVEHEVRLGYVFGSVGAVAQRPVDPANAPIDIRFATEVSRMRMEASEVLERAARRVAAQTRLKVFTADVLLSTEGKAWWVDINPDGLFIAADDESETLSTTFRTGLFASLY